MDIKREGASRKRLIRRIIYGFVLVFGIIGTTLAVGKLKPAIPTAEKSTVWIDVVKRGSMLRQVHGVGTLIPEEVLWIPAETDARVTKINVRPGTSVKPDTVILEMDSPDVKLAALNAEFDLKAAEAGMIDLRVQLESQSFDQKATAATVKSDYVQATMQADRDKKLAKEGLIPDLQMRISTTKAEELSTRNQIELDRLKIVNQSVQAQLDAQKVKVEQLRAVYVLKKRQVEKLIVRAGTTGILQALGPPTVVGTTTVAPPLEAGQKVTAGTILAKIARPERLKADVKIAETEAKDIVLGQPSEVDTHNGVIPGKVIRIDPASVNGTVAVDIGLTGALPQGARPDLNVDGTILLEKLTNVLYMGRPVSGQSHTDITIFKMDPDGKTAVRTKVKLGRASVNTIEILEGLREGDQVILSDMSTYDSHDRIRLN